MGKTVLKVKELDWGRYDYEELDAAAQFIWAKKLGVDNKDIKVKMRSPELVEIEVKNMDPPQIKEKVRK
jgi:hypothetical protein